jgi:hypothetical protein
MHFKCGFCAIRKFTEYRALTFRRVGGANLHLMLGSRETGYLFSASCSMGGTESITYDLRLGLRCLQQIVQAASENAKSHSILLAII